MNYVLSVVRADPWVFFGVVIGLISVASTMTSDASKLKRASAGVLAVLVSFGITAGVGGLMNRFEADGLKHFINTSLEGSFTSTGGQLGTWTIHPSSCLDGHERGFQGTLLAFDSGPVKELRIETVRKKQKLVSVYLDDEKGSVVQLRAGDCDAVTAETHTSNVELNGLDMRRLRGSLTVSCARAGLTGHAEFDGCLPQTVADSRH
ncbi:MAG: hypothetical protein JWN04_6785 [Myxococcaceae bacterium]|nr:hypothetical protein [Myxococcaceae bacterium]